MKLQSSAKKAQNKQNTGRGSEDLWLDAAYQVLIDSGVDAVKVMPLAKLLNLSRTSFYWHFDSREALLDALIIRWKQKNTGNLIEQTRKYAESISEAMFNLFDCWIDTGLFDARLEFAIRHWALNSEQLKSALEEIDQQRIEAIQDMFIRFKYKAGNAATRARTVYYTQVGYISMMVDEPLAVRLDRMPDYSEVFTGVIPTETEIARFRARH